MEALSPLHQSRLNERNAWRPRPRPSNMDMVALADEQRVALEKIALSIFTDMTNAGCSLQEVLAAIYLSGLKHGQEISL